MKTCSHFHMLRSSVIIIASLLLLSSCKLTLHAIDLSLEFNRQQYKIKGLTKPSRNAARPGINMALMWHENMRRVLYDEEPGDNSYIESQDNTLATTGSDRSLFDYPSTDSPSFMATYMPAENNFPEELYAMGGIELALKASDDGGEKINLFYLEVPLYALYVKELSLGNVYGGLGPWFAYGLGGNTKDNTGGVTEEHNSFDKVSGFRRFDAGWSITAGYSFPNGIDLRLDYSSGFANIGRGNERITNKTFALHAMYLLMRNK